MMTASRYWYVEKVHAKQAYNDNDKFALKNGKGETVSTAIKFDELNKIAIHHNKSLIEKEPTPADTEISSKP